MKRGEIWWYEFPSPNKRRPVLILTRDASIAVLNAITVAENANAVIPEGMSEEDEWVGVEVESESL